MRRKNFEYKKIEKEIKQKGYKQVEEERKAKLLKIFKEMFCYKNKQYDENWTFEEQIYKISIYYHAYALECETTLTSLNEGIVRCSIEEEPIKVNDIEKIILLDNFYKTLLLPEYSYKERAYEYKEFELKEGETYEDLYNQEIEKFIKLFKKMLEMKNIKYKPTNNIESLQILVEKHYPELEHGISNLISNDVDKTYIQLLNGMELIYEQIEKKYKIQIN